MTPARVDWRATLGMVLAATSGAAWGICMCLAAQTERGIDEIVLMRKHLTQAMGKEEEG